MMTQHTECVSHYSHRESIHTDKIFGPNPTTSRGVALHVYAHPKEPKIIYPSGKYVVVKSLIDPSDCFVYRAHQHPVTVAKFSPNGYWVASGGQKNFCKPNHD